MGVHGLWRLIESSGKPVPLETLENKVLAVDISIWLHQAIKGFQDAKGAPVPNAHLLGVYHRLCKLLYYRIRPICVFDGGVPVLKKQTIAKRNELKYQHEDESEKIRQQILTSLIQQSAISTALVENLTQLTQSTKISPKKNSRRNEDDDIFKLPELPLSQPDITTETTENSSDSEETSPFFRKHYIDINSIDESSEKFKSLPADVRHDILTEIKENSKNSRWKDIYAPAHNGAFSQAQIKRLLKRRSIQVSLEEAEKEMGGHTLSMGDLEAILCQEGIVTSSKMAAKRRIASDDNTRYLLIKDLQKAKKELEEKKLREIKEEEEDNKEEIKEESIVETKLEEFEPKKDIEKYKISACSKTEDEDYDLAVAIQLSLAEESTAKQSKRKIDLVDDVNEPSTSKKFESSQHDKYQEIDDLESDPELQQAIKLSLETENKNVSSSSTSSQETEGKIEPITRTKHKTEDLTYYKGFNDNEVTASSSEDEITLSPVAKGATLLSKAYLMEYSDLTPAEIEKFLKMQNEHKKELKPKDFFPHEMLLNSPTSQKIPEETENQIEKQDKDEENQLEGVQVLSDSDESDDFVEVTDNKQQSPPLIKPNSVLELVIKPEDKIEDDLFADVFTDNKQKFQLEKILEAKNKQDESAVKIKETEHVTSSSLKTCDKILSKQNLHENKISEITNYTNIEVVSKLQSEEQVNQNISIQLDDNIENEISRNEEDEIKQSENVEKVEQNSETQENQLSIQKLSKKELLVMKENLEAENELLLKEKAHEDRMATNITDQMYKETQDLLELFGVPYIIAPMEAEAQCAYLDEINLTNGTITDDSDIWLFGGKTVYKNFFSQKKQVLEFRAENIQHHFKLSREQLILLALLVGSDYTLGIQGVGPVTALEILAAFPASKQETIVTQDELISGLQHFKNWWRNGRIVGPGKTSLRNKLKNITLHEGFPNIQVVNAYLKPAVDLSEESFSWGKPNLEKLLEFSKIKFGWSEVKSNEILIPVLKRWQDPKSQKSILEYFNSRPVKKSEVLLSKRVQKALNRIQKTDTDSEDEVEPPKKSRSKKSKTDSNNKTTEETESKKPKRRPRKKKLEEPKVVTEEINIKPLNKIQEKLKDFKNVTTKKYEEVIPQREKDRINALKTKLRAIELYRKSKYGPGFVNKKTKTQRPVKEDAELSESSSDEK